MFREDTVAVAAAIKAQAIPSGEYESDITGVRMMDARESGKFGACIINCTITEGEYEGMDYDYFLTLSPKASGLRAGFYSNIGYVLPEDGGVDETDFIGRPVKIVVVNDGQVKVQRTKPSSRLAEDDFSSAPLEEAYVL